MFKDKDYQGIAEYVWASFPDWLGYRPEFLVGVFNVLLITIASYYVGATEAVTLYTQRYKELSITLPYNMHIFFYMNFVLLVASFTQVLRWVFNTLLFIFFL